jgi:hypothetical protein
VGDRDEGNLLFHLVSALGAALAARRLVSCIPERMAVRRAVDPARHLNALVEVLVRTHSGAPAPARARRGTSTSQR